MKRYIAAGMAAMAAWAAGWAGAQDGSLAAYEGAKAVDFAEVNAQFF